MVDKHNIEKLSDAEYT